MIRKIAIGLLSVVLTGCAGEYGRVKNIIFAPGTAEQLLDQRAAADDALRAVAEKLSARVDKPILMGGGDYALRAEYVNGKKSFQIISMHTLGETTVTFRQGDERADFSAALTALTLYKTELEKRGFIYDEEPSSGARSYRITGDWRFD